MKKHTIEVDIYPFKSTVINRIQDLAKWGYRYCIVFDVRGEWKTEERSIVMLEKAAEKYEMGSEHILYKVDNGFLKCEELFTKEGLKPRFNIDIEEEEV